MNCINMTTLKLVNWLRPWKHGFFFTILGNLLQRGALVSVTVVFKHVSTPALPLFSHTDWKKQKIKAATIKTPSWECSRNNCHRSMENVQELRTSGTWFSVLDTSAVSSSFVCTLLGSCSLYYLFISPLLFWSKPVWKTARGLPCATSPKEESEKNPSEVLELQCRRTLMDTVFGASVETLQ